MLEGLSLVRVSDLFREEKASTDKYLLRLITVKGHAGSDKLQNIIKYGTMRLPGAGWCGTSFLK